MSWKRQHDQVQLVNKFWKRPKGLKGTWKRPKQDFGKGQKKRFWKRPTRVLEKTQLGKCTLDGFGKGHHVYRSG